MNIQFTNHNLLTDSSDRGHSESPGKSMTGHRNNGSHRGQTSMYYFNDSAYCRHSAISGATTVHFHSQWQYTPYTEL